MTEHTKPFAAAAEQNKHDILDVLRNELEPGDDVLELGSGTGQHCCHFASHLPKVQWQPTDLADKLDGINNGRIESGCQNMLPALKFDVAVLPWPELKADVCYSANTFHIVSWAAITALFIGCASVLPTAGKLCVYGPFLFSGQIAGYFSAESNLRFDRMLRRSDPLSGVRGMQQLDELAVRNHFKPARIVSMPVNNFLAIWQKL